ncbi:CAP domain-containing protein [Mycobacterium sp. shizuoka-1]|uniref:CAP domain-containing protein n=1 Tax=Mycobacterium sp. shizuoka-1 TaxID=2039281 RepID=UPI000C063B14|nr:CAP domain-containing protein [Mycobacterium sp. shizuoka-1]GAY16752.1 hypothetical protein MSZK_34780 [Mycobacterium sp. shizuoka-1]
MHGMRRAAAALGAMAVAGTGPANAVAGAEPGSGLEQAVSAARAGSPCGPLRYDARVERAADIVNRSTMSYVNHTADTVPADDPHPTGIVADVGVVGAKVISLQGAGHEFGDAVHSVLLEGRTAIPDCAYTDFGASVIDDAESGYIFTVVILVGP